MPDEFNKGDVVQLKSGGPPMTVDSVPSDPGYMGEQKGVYHCTWFKGATRDNGNFTPHLIKAYEPPAAKK